MTVTAPRHELDQHQEVAGPRAAFGEFTALLAPIIGADLSTATPQTLLVEDLGWDSLTMVEALGVLDTTGVALPDELICELRTLGDIHHYYCTATDPEKADRGRSRFEGPNVVLVPPSARDHDWLYSLCATGDHLVGYRLRGVTPSPEAFHRFLWDRVLAQFIVTTREQRPIGLVTSFEPDFRNRYAYLAAIADPEWQDSGLVLEGMMVLVDYLFAQFDLRKLYAESLESNFAHYDNGLGRVFEIEGRLRQHEYINGAYEDLVVVGIWRQRFEEHQRRVFAR